ncbi:unnamed protein product [Ilex paraguariensis]|uniref:Red chlorophyll catabolite reductase n=1 Tax=Ilex paraguariensis TaxID=185542 RepID=A0ABC8TGU2_9AQUA
MDYILGSWIHSNLPSGEALDITSLSAYLNPLTDAPNFLIELIQRRPTSMVLILDLPPRRELVLHPDYLKAFYEDTQLDRHRQFFEKLPEVQPYFSSSLYVRCALSPTAIIVLINGENSEHMEEIVRDHVSPVAKEVLGVWLELCACGERQVGETDRAYLEKRGQMTKRKTLEVDLGSSFPRLFGQEIADRVLGVLREVFNV